MREKPLVVHFHRYQSGGKTLVYCVALTWAGQNEGTALGGSPKQLNFPPLPATKLSKFVQAVTGMVVVAGKERHSLLGRLWEPC